MTNENWRVHSEVGVLHHSFVSVALQHVELPDGTVIRDWPIIHTRDYVNVAALNDHDELMVLNGYKHGLGRASWQVPGGYLEPDEDPLEAVKRELLEETGYASNDWQALGSFVVDANRRVGVGHFFLARSVQFLTPAHHDDLEAFEICWIAKDEVSRALSDGRVGIMSHATCISLALLANFGVRGVSSQ
jgi:ADP-ribose pyrophosphatase